MATTQGGISYKIALDASAAISSLKDLGSSAATVDSTLAKLATRDVTAAFTGIASSKKGVDDLASSVVGLNASMGAAQKSSTGLGSSLTQSNTALTQSRSSIAATTSSLTAFNNGLLISQKSAATFGSQIAAQMSTAQRSVTSAQTSLANAAKQAVAPKVSVNAEGVSQGTAALGGFSSALKGVEDQLHGFKEIAIEAFAFEKLVEGTAKVFELANAYEKASQSIKTVSNNIGEMQSAQAAVYDIAEKTHQPLEEVAKVYTQVRQVFVGFGKSQAEAMLATQNILQLSMLGEGDQSNARMELMHGLQSGTMSEGVFRRLTQDNPQMATGIARGLGEVGVKYADKPVESPGQAKLAMAGGNVTSEQMMNALLSPATTKYANTLSSSLPVAVQGGFEDVKNSLKEFFGRLDQDAGITDTLNAIQKTVAESIHSMVSSGSMDQDAKEFGDWFRKISVEGMTWIGDTVKSLSTLWDSQAAAADRGGTSLGTQIKNIGTMLSSAGQELKSFKSEFDLVMTGVHAVSDNLGSDVVEFGVLGKVLFGTKGAVVLAGAAAIFDKIQEKEKSYEDKQANGQSTTFAEDWSHTASQLAHGDTTPFSVAWQNSKNLLNYGLNGTRADASYIDTAPAYSSVIPRPAEILGINENSRGNSIFNPHLSNAPSSPPTQYQTPAQAGIGRPVDLSSVVTQLVTPGASSGINPAIISSLGLNAQPNTSATSDADVRTLLSMFGVVPANQNSQPAANTSSVLPKISKSWPKNWAPILNDGQLMSPSQDQIKSQMSTQLKNTNVGTDPNTASMPPWMQSAVANIAAVQKRTDQRWAQRQAGNSGDPAATSGTAGDPAFGSALPTPGSSGGANPNAEADKKIAELQTKVNELNKLIASNPGFEAKGMAEYRSSPELDSLHLSQQVKTANDAVAMLPKGTTDDQKKKYYELEMQEQQLNLKAAPITTQAGLQQSSLNNMRDLQRSYAETGSDMQRLNTAYKSGDDAVAAMNIQLAAEKSIRTDLRSLPADQAAKLKSEAVNAALLSAEYTKLNSVEQMRTTNARTTKEGAIMSSAYSTGDASVVDDTQMQIQAYEKLRTTIQGLTEDKQKAAIADEVTALKAQQRATAIADSYKREQAANSAFAAAPVDALTSVITGQKKPAAALHDMASSMGQSFLTNYVADPAKNLFTGLLNGKSFTDASAGMQTPVSPLINKALGWLGLGGGGTGDKSNPLSSLASSSMSVANATITVASANILGGGAGGAGSSAGGGGLLGSMFGSSTPSTPAAATDGSSGSGGGLTGWISSAFNSISGFFGGGTPAGHALGGPVIGGMPVIVGEAGREIFVPSQPGHIVTNQAAFGGGSGGGRSGGITVNMTVQSPDARGFRDSTAQIARQMKRYAA